MPGGAVLTGLGRGRSGRESGPELAASDPAWAEPDVPPRASGDPRFLHLGPGLEESVGSVSSPTLHSQKGLCTSRPWVLVAWGQRSPALRDHREEELALDKLLGWAQGGRQRASSIVFERAERTLLPGKAQQKHPTPRPCPLTPAWPLTMPAWRGPAPTTGTQVGAERGGSWREPSARTHLFLSQPRRPRSPRARESHVAGHRQAGPAGGSQRPEPSVPDAGETGGEPAASSRAQVSSCPVTVPRNHFGEKLPGRAFRAPRGPSFHRGPPSALMRDTEASGRACERTGQGDVKPWRPGRGLCPERFSHTQPCNEACLEGSLGVGYGQDIAAKMSV